MNPVRCAYFDEIFVRNLGPEVCRNGQFVDVGCGGGILAECLARRGYRIVGVDVSEGALNTARSHAAAAGLRIDYRRGSAYDLAVPPGTVDGVIASDIFEHLHDLPRAVAEMARILKPGGLLVFDTVNRTWLSLLGAIWIVEKWLGILPGDTHRWRMFIRPGELGSVLDRFGLKIGELRGLRPAASLHRLLYNLWKHRRFGPYVLSGDLRISYIGFALKSRGSSSTFE